MVDALDQVWQRAEIHDHVLTAAELALWEPEQRDAILKLGLLRRISDATVITCEDCGSPHPVEVIRDPHRPAEPYYLCPEIGRVRSKAEDLHLWEVDFEQLAVLIRQTIGLTSKAVTVATSRIWLLGRQQIGDRCWELFLVRGLCWPDGPQLLSHCSRLQQSPAPIIVVPHRLPADGISVTSFLFRTLSELVSLRDSGFAVDAATLASAVGALGIDGSALGRKAPRKRMSRSLGTPEAVIAVTRYLEHTQLTDTQFGNQFNSTDRTVRKFRSTGVMRRSNFEAMATSMGLTSDQLLRGDLPASLNRATRT